MTLPRLFNGGSPCKFTKPLVQASTCILKKTDLSFYFMQSARQVKTFWRQCICMTFPDCWKIQAMQTIMIDNTIFSLRFLYLVPNGFFWLHQFVRTVISLTNIGTACVVYFVLFCLYLGLVLLLLPIWILFALLTKISICILVKYERCATCHVILAFAVTC